MSWLVLPIKICSIIYFVKLEALPGTAFVFYCIVTNETARQSHHVIHLIGRFQFLLPWSF